MGNTRRYSPPDVPGKVGAKGNATKQDLLLALQHELTQTSWRELGVPAVATLASRSPAVFYCYWANLDEAFADLLVWLTDQGVAPGVHLLLIEELLAYESEMGTSDE
jgi:hypothetical protein